MDIQNKIEKTRELLGNLDPQDADRISSWEKTVKEQTLILALSQEDGIKLFNSKLLAKIDQINRVLVDKEEMTEEERRILIKIKGVWIWVLSFFTKPEKILEELNKRLDHEITELNKFNEGN